MARTRVSYSESHDYSKHPSRKGKRKVSAPTPYVPGPPPDTSVGFLPKNLSEEQRRELRARQLAASQVQAVLPDRDLMHRPGDATDPREVGGYHTLETGPYGKGRPFPVDLGPQFTHVNVRDLNDNEIHPPLHPDMSPLRPSDINASLELIAAVSADDKEILAFDNELSNLHTTLRSLRQKAQQMVKAVRGQDDNPGSEDSPTSHAQNIVHLIAAIIEPWVNVLEDQFTDLLNESTQAKELDGME